MIEWDNTYNGQCENTFEKMLISTGMNITKYTKEVRHLHTNMYSEQSVLVKKIKLRITFRSAERFSLLDFYDQNKSPSDGSVKKKGMKKTETEKKKKNGSKQAVNNSRKEQPLT